MTLVTRTDWPAVKAWRKQARHYLLAARNALSATQRQLLTGALISRLAPLLESAQPPISFYWPFRGEPDLRPLMRRLAAQGADLALPVATRLGEPLTFRPWAPGVPMMRGIWDIPIPAEERTVEPNTIIAPCVGYDPHLYRLGYGGGFFDRTLAAQEGTARAIPPRTIGIGYSLFALPTIYPQPHDIALSQIVTDRAPGMATDENDSSSPVCYATEMDDAYAGRLSPAEIASALRPIYATLAPERRPLLDFVFWRLGCESPAPISGGDSSIDIATILDRLRPRVADDAIHAALAALTG